MRRSLLTVLLVAGCARVGPPPTLPPPPAPDTEPLVIAEDARPRRLSLPEVPAPLPEEHREIRALWVVRTTLTSAERILQMVEEAHRGGFNTLLVQVRGRGDAYFHSDLEPRADALAGQADGFDPLAMVLREAHARGMAVHAWLNTHLVAGLDRLPRAPTHLVNAAPEYLAVPRELARDLFGVEPTDRRYARTLLRWAQRNTRRVEGLYTSPLHPGVHDHVVAVWRDLVERYPVDGVHFDYVRYAGPDFDYSRTGLTAFRDWARSRIAPERGMALDQEARTDPLTWADSLPDLWRLFRRERLTALVGAVREGVMAARPDLIVSAAVIADPVVADERHLQDWPGWLRTGILDIAAPMAYTDDDDLFQDLVQGAIGVSRDSRRIWAGIGTYLTGFDGTVRKMAIAREHRVGGMVVFSYDWASAQRPIRAGLSFLEAMGRRSFPPPT